LFTTSKQAGTSPASMQGMGQGGVGLDRIVETLGEDAVTVLAAPHGLNVPVSGPRLYDPADPTAIAPGELVLAVNVEAVEQVVADASAAGAAAVAIRSPQVAGLHAELAVLAVSPNATWDQVFRVVQTLAASGPDDDQAPVRDLFSLANALAALLGGAVTIEDPSSSLLAYSNLDQPIDEARRQTILGRGHGHEWAGRLREIGTFRPLVASPGTVVHVVDPLGQARSRLAASVGAGGELLGFIWVVEGDRPFTPQDEESLRASLPLAALHLLQHRKSDDVTRRERGLVLRQTLLGDEPPEVLGFPLDSRCAVAAFRLAVRDRADLRLKRGKAVDLITLAAEAFRRRVVCAWIDDTVYSLFPAVDGTRSDRLLALCRKTAEQARTALDVEVVVGVGGTVPLRDLRRSRDEADRTVRVLLERGTVAAHVDEVRVQTTLLAAADLLLGREEIRIPAVDELAALDAKGGGELTATLRAYVRSGGSITSTSKALGVHPNSVRYRLARIAEATGLGLADPDTLLAVALHFRVEGDAAERPPARQLPGWK